MIRRWRSTQSRRALDFEDYTWFSETPRRSRGLKADACGGCRRAVAFPEEQSPTPASGLPKPEADPRQPTTAPRELPWRARPRPRNMRSDARRISPIQQQILVGRPTPAPSSRQANPDQGDRRGGEEGAGSVDGPEGPPLPPRQGQAGLGGGSGAVPGDRAGLGGVRNLNQAPPQNLAAHAALELREARPACRAGR